jgi:hypothetical protein
VLTLTLTCIPSSLNSLYALNMTNRFAPMITNQGKSVGCDTGLAVPINQISIIFMSVFVCVCVFASASQDFLFCTFSGVFGTRARVTSIWSMDIFESWIPHAGRCFPDRINPSVLMIPSYQLDQSRFWNVCVAWTLSLAGVHIAVLQIQYPAPADNTLPRVLAPISFKAAAR